MITLTNTTHIIEVNTSEETNVDVFCSYADHTTSGATLGDQQTLITTATNTTIISAPDASTQRQIKVINIRNTSATTNIVTVKKDISGTEYDLFSCTLGGGEQIEYLDGRGWQVYTTTGAIKNSINQGSAPISSSLSATVLSSNVVNNNATLNTIQDVTGLSFAVTAGHVYYFQFIIPYTAAATTTGSRWSVNGPATTYLCYTSEYSLAATTTTRNANNISYDLPATSNATSAGTTSGNRTVVEGVIIPSADGTVIARFASEVANSAITALAGSVVYYQELI
jgi:hypothetical protein